ncbi:MAG TPA: cytochrome c oxidase subunit II [Candidatus Dormibacteraeota bacterium]|nr:cytochrome c oxidase subunit II [Candidatus Dormibacteraeota bacterium]
MQSQMSIYPDQASNFAPQVDALMIFITGICLFFAVAVTVAIIYFFFKYRRTHAGEIGKAIHGDMRLEAAWIVVPLMLSLCMFGWGAVVYVNFRVAPKDTLDIYVVGKQWMFKAQQPNGLREINELHVPVGRDVRLILGSEDVIHDFFVPAFRVKMDVMPGRYNTMWFRPTKAGRYHFFCAQYCGTNHAKMGGWVTVMEAPEYAAWLSGSTGSELSPVAAGEKLFTEKACVTCHISDGTGRAPSLNGVYGANVLLSDGSTVAADDAYIRESILNPAAKVVARYQPIMPTFQGQLTEEQILSLTSYIKSLQSQPVPAKGYGMAPAAAAAAGKK